MRGWKLRAKNKALQENLAQQIQRDDVSMHINWRTEPTHAVSFQSLFLQNPILEIHRDPAEKGQWITKQILHKCITNTQYESRLLSCCRSRKKEKNKKNKRQLMST